MNSIPVFYHLQLSKDGHPASRCVASPAPHNGVLVAADGPPKCVPDMQSAAIEGYSICIPLLCLMDGRNQETCFLLTKF